MGRNIEVKYKKNWAWGWGVFLLLVAALVLTNQFGGFIELGVWSIIVAALAVAFLIQSIVSLSFASLPIPIAALYYIFHAPLGLPGIPFWPLVLVTLLATAGLFALLPKRLFRNIRKHVNVVYSNDDVVSNVRDVNEAEQIEEGGSDNNPHISVQFGGVSRYLHAERLETVNLDCSFGSLEVYFDHVELSPDGAEAFLSCQFGSIELYVPSQWIVIDNMSTSLGGVDIKGRRDIPDENAPRLKITGSVSFGSVEVHRI
ncbi:MAG: cell wall-active antibiotics response protein [Defluviitaleaceae bacterium]|nr:cell wall-active antibiotics response protein [Defluviitaleaceae bacterium]